MDRIPGLNYIPNAIDEPFIMRDLDANKWTPVSGSKNGRVVQQYGYIYDYSRSNALVKTEPLPEFLQPYHDVLRYYRAALTGQASAGRDNMRALMLAPLDMNQCIVNNYNNKQSISKHIDSHVFGPVIGCFSIGDCAIMRFTNANNSVDVCVEPNSLYIMSGDARYGWSHEMLPHKGTRRISITFRSVIQ
jgi:alkylated DNA repair dioxygenase AlkB